LFTASGEEKGDGKDRREQMFLRGEKRGNGKETCSKEEIS
jgi:hypothetical protein